MVLSFFDLSNDLSRAALSFKMFHGKLMSYSIATAKTIVTFLTYLTKQEKYEVYE
jgi:hypothetical protein